MTARSGGVVRCEHGFLRGLCVVASCPNYEGDVDPQSTLPCQSCGGRTRCGTGGRISPTSARHCPPCNQERLSSRRRREAQKAYAL